MSPTVTRSRGGLRPGVCAAAAAATAAIVLTVAAPTQAAVTTTTLRDADAAAAASVAFGEGATLASATVAAGVDVQIGTYSALDLGDGAESGLALSTGSLIDADPAAASDVDFTASALVGPNEKLTTTGDFGGAGYEKLTTLAGTTTYDAAALELSVVPAGSTLELEFRFGSEEYATWADQAYTDAVGVWIDGELCSVLPSGDAAGISTVNSATNAELYTANFDGRTPGAIDTEFNGFTAPLTCSADVVAGEPVTVSLAVADTVDGQLDTTLLVSAASITAPAAESPTTPGAGGTGGTGGAGGTDGTVSGAVASAPSSSTPSSSSGYLPATGGSFDPTFALIAGGLLAAGGTAFGVSAWRRRHAVVEASE